MHEKVLLEDLKREGDTDNNGYGNWKIVLISKSLINLARSKQNTGKSLLPTFHLIVPSICRFSRISRPVGRRSSVLSQGVMGGKNRRVHNFPSNPMIKYSKNLAWSYPCIEFVDLIRTLNLLIKENLIDQSVDGITKLKISSKITATD